MKQSWDPDPAEALANTTVQMHGLAGVLFRVHVQCFFLIKIWGVPCTTRGSRPLGWFSTSAVPNPFTIENARIQTFQPTTRWTNQRDLRRSSGEWEGAKYDFYQKCDLRRDDKHNVSPARCPGTDACSTPNYILRLVILWSPSENRRTSIKYSN